MDPIPDTVYPEGSVIGNFDGSGNPYETQELLHRPHAFALMHGDGGAKVAYGELHWRVDVFTLEFKQEDLTCSIDDHSDHTHTAGVGSHTHEHDHSHTTRPHTHNYDHFHTTDAAGGYGSHTHDTVYQNNSNTGSEVTESGSAQSPDEATTGNINGGSGTVTTSGASATLDHTCTITPSQITYCRQAGQDAIAQITQTTPKLGEEPEGYTPPAEGEADTWLGMDAGINDSKYHQLSSYGDVYLCWKVDLQNVGGEVEKCWVQVGDPTGTAIGSLLLGSSTTERRAVGDPDIVDATGQPEGDDVGVYKVKLGTVTENNQITQLVSSDVVWSPTVMDRVLVT